MAYNNYISELISLRRDLENRIDREIEDSMNGMGDSKRLKESIECVIELSPALKGKYKKEECISP